MATSIEGLCLETERLWVNDWHRGEEPAVLDLASSVAQLMTSRTTKSLPEPWRGDYSIDRARRWIAERDAESPTLLVTDRSTGAAIGLLILFPDPSQEEATRVDVRFGYLFDDAVWGQGLASELVAGLVRWCRSDPRVASLTAGVEVANAASARVLIKNGFMRVRSESEGNHAFRLEFPGDPWDEYAAGWDDDPAARSYASAAFSSLLALLNERGATLAGSRVCDFGCGTGLLTEKLVETAESIDAVDSSTAMLEVLTSKSVENKWSQVRLGRTAPDGYGTHDLVICSSVCSFLADYVGTVKRFADLLRPGGLFIQWDWERDDADSGTHGLSRREIKEAISAAGLVDVFVDTAFQIEVDGQRMEPLIGVGAKPPTVHR